VTPFKDLHIDESDIESLRWNRFKGKIASTPARIAMMVGAFLFGAGAGALALNPVASSTYPYCVMPLAVASRSRNRLFLAVIGILATLGLAFGHWVVGPAYSQMDGLTGGTYYGVWSVKG